MKPDAPHLAIRLACGKHVIFDADPALSDAEQRMMKDRVIKLASPTGQSVSFLTLPCLDGVRIHRTVRAADFLGGRHDA